MTAKTNTTSQHSRWQQSSLRTRFLVGIMTITILAMAIVAVSIATTIGGVNSFLTEQFSETTRNQAIQQLDNTVINESANFEAFLSNITDDLSITGNYVSDLLDKQESLGQGSYWDALNEMELLSEGQWGNKSSNDPGSVLAPSSFLLSEETALTVNSTIYLDFIIPDLLEKNPELLAIYYVSNQGVTQYYPNIDLASIVGDFDARERPYYQAFSEGTAENRSYYWTEPYIDAALGGLVETNSVPIYDDAGNLQGVLGADVAISTITDHVTEFAFGESGYAFLVDPSGRFIALTEAAYEDLGLTSNDISEGGIPTKTGFDITTEIAPIVSRMIAGEQGVETFFRDGIERFVAYAPIESVGYSLAIVAPAPELLANYYSAEGRVNNQLRSGWLGTGLILIVILIAVITLSIWVSNTLTKPITSLTQAAQKVSSGELDVQVAVQTGGEVGSLANAFNTMTTRIRDLVGSLEKQVSSQTQALQIATEVGRQLATILNPSQLASEVVNQVQAAFNYYHVHIYLLNEEEQKLELAGGTGEAGKVMLDHGHSLHLNQGLVGQAATTKEPVLIPDVTKDVNWLPNPLLPDTKAETAVPIIYGENLLGVLDVQHDVVDGLTEDNVSVLQSVAAQVAIALRNARLYDQAQSQAEQQKFINEIGRQIQTAANLERVLQITTRELTQALQVKRASIEIGHEAIARNGRTAGRK